MSSNSPTLYGEPLPGTPITVLDIIRKPLVIFRFMNMIFAIIVFSSISSGAWNMNNMCIFNNTSSLCNFAVVLGVISMLITLTFLIIDIIFVTIASASSRRAIVITDMFLANSFLICWLVCAIVLIIGWWMTDLTLVIVNMQQYQLIQVAVAFSILGAAAWGAISFFAASRFRKGKEEMMEFSDNINRAVNQNFDMLPGGVQGTVSGSNVNPPIYQAPSTYEHIGEPQVSYTTDTKGNNRMMTLY